MHEEVLIFIALFATIFGLFFLRGRENMAMIEKGLNPRKTYAKPKQHGYVKYALLLVGAGIGLFVAYMLDVMVLQELTRSMRADGTYYYHENPAIYFSLLAIGGGLGLFSAYKIEKKNNDIEDDTIQ